MLYLKKPVNFRPHETLYAHLIKIKNNHNYFYDNKTDILVKLTSKNYEFGTLMQYTVDSLYFILWENINFNSLELTITDEDNNITDFHCMPIYYILEISKKNNL